MDVTSIICWENFLRSWSRKRLIRFDHTWRSGVLAICSEWCELHEDIQLKAKNHRMSRDWTSWHRTCWVVYRWRVVRKKYQQFFEWREEFLCYDILDGCENMRCLIWSPSSFPSPSSWQKWEKEKRGLNYPPLWLDGLQVHFAVTNRPKMTPIVRYSSAHFFARSIDLGDQLSRK